MIGTPSVQLIDMVTEAGLPLSIFMNMVVMEEFTQSEIDDLEYMESKIEIYLEEYDDGEGRFFDE